MKSPRGLAGEVLATLADAGRGLTLQQIQALLEGYHESPVLSATLVRLERAGLVVTGITERTADKGRRLVKCYQLMPASAPANVDKC